MTMKPYRLLRHHGRYNAGEIAGFDDVTAKRLGATVLEPYVKKTETAVVALTLTADTSAVETMIAESHAKIVAEDERLSARSDGLDLRESDLDAREKALAEREAALAAAADTAAVELVEASTDETGTAAEYVTTDELPAQGKKK